MHVCDMKFKPTAVVPRWSARSVLLQPALALVLCSCRCCSGYLHLVQTWDSSLPEATLRVCLVRNLLLPGYAAAAATVALRCNVYSALSQQCHFAADTPAWLSDGPAIRLFVPFQRWSQCTSQVA
jgi:hypothetical protein